ncbi:MAG: molybdopterin cofactor-binding domain-containing protein, partial [candidate division Zixibacteria bacterium]|nr:molybdopterin cofactor-binding domain-containing protein [candidate division Zixibacteria bacterium]
SKGDIKKAFGKAENVFEDEYQTGYQEHIYIEPQGIVAEYKNDKMNIYGSMQCPFYVEGAIQDVLGWKANRVRVIHSTTGGAFGGKEEFPSLLACQVAVASIKTNRPVKIIYDRNEDIISSTKRHPSVIKYKIGLDENNKIIALEIDINFNAGAYSTISPVVLQRGIFTATGVYNIQNLKVKGKNYKTNTVPNGAYRGFGAPQSGFAIEMLMTNIAKKLEINSLKFKEKYLIKHGDYTATNGMIRGEVKLPEMIKLAKKISNYETNSKDKNKLIGVGVSLFSHGCGFTGKGENDIKGKIILKKIDEQVFINVSSVEMGQGAETVLRKIVAYTLSIPIAKVTYEIPDTKKVPDSGPTVASRTTMIVGGLLKSASLELKEKWNSKEKITITRIYKHPDFLKWDDDKFEGDAYPVYSYGINIAKVEVDPITLEIDIKKMWAVYDVGTIIDERALLGQMQGGMLQGIGWATIEIMNSKKGKLVQKNMTDYKIPTMKDFPKFEIRFIENPYEFGPFGAKCAGELPLLGPPPAIAEAVSNALNIQIKQ